MSSGESSNSSSSTEKKKSKKGGFWGPFCIGFGVGSLAGAAVTLGVQEYQHSDATPTPTPSTLAKK